MKPEVPIRRKPLRREPRHQTRREALWFRRARVPKWMRKWHQRMADYGAKAKRA